MIKKETELSEQERRWLIERRITRLTDNHEVQIYPMGAERYLSSILFAQDLTHYPIKEDIAGKNILLIPGHGNSAFLFAKAQAKKITVYDKDPVTIAWQKAFKKYYYYRESQDDVSYPSIGELLAALTCWRPPLLRLPQAKLSYLTSWLLQPHRLRQVYLFYLLSLVNSALRAPSQEHLEFEANISFSAGTISAAHPTQTEYDTVYIPYLLGVKNGIEQQEEITALIHQLLSMLKPQGRILITPFRNTREFIYFGKRYTKIDLSSLPVVQELLYQKDEKWYRTQGLLVLQKKPT